MKAFPRTDLGQTRSPAWPSPGRLSPAVLLQHGLEHRRPGISGHGRANTARLQVLARLPSSLKWPEIISDPVFSWPSERFSQSGPSGVRAQVARHPDLTFLFLTFAFLMFLLSTFFPFSFFELYFTSYMDTNTHRNK